VPDITGKLIRPERRGSLNKHKKEFWDIVIKKQEHIKCIYTKEPLYIGTYDLEHFVPFQFVAHDLMWNLLPASPSFNRKKGDKLPSFEKYFTDFYLTQKNAIELIKERNEKNTFLEHYLTIFPDLEINEERYKDCIQPLITIASNNGFNFLK
jgi:CRISPR/Cas system Type II protein with McrA/HNH and RuvC-like nuclease domain